MLSCELISADYRLTQSAEMIFWAVHHVEAESTCQADSVLVIVLFSRGHLIGDISVEYSCELLSADCCLTQFAEMTA